MNDQRKREQEERKWEREEEEREAQIAAAKAEEAQQLYSYLDPIFAPRPGALRLVICAAPTAWLERTASGEYRTYVDLSDGEYHRTTCPDLRSACCDLVLGLWNTCSPFLPDLDEWQALIADQLPD